MTKFVNSESLESGEKVRNANGTVVNSNSMEELKVHMHTGSID